MFVSVIAVACGGGVGAALRYLASQLVGRYLASLTIGGLALGTIFVNVVGCFAIGLLTPVLADRFPGNDTVSLFLVTGLLGGFTTMSTFSKEAYTLWTGSQYGAAAAYVLLTLVICLAAVALGFVAGTRLSAK